MFRLTGFHGAARVLAPPLFILILGCGPESVSKGAPPVTTASTPQSAVGVKDSTHPKAASDSGARDSAVVRPAPATPAAHAAHAALPPPSVVRRTSHDSISYTAAIR